MVDYGLVPRQINALSNRVAGLGERSRRHEETMGNLQLQGAQMDANMMGLSAERAMRIEQAKREQYLNEPVTLGQAIQTSKFPDAQKAELLKQIPNDVLMVPTTRKKAFEAYQALMQEQAKSQRESQKQQSEIEQKGLDRASRERIAAMNRKSQEKIASERQKTEKDNRPNMQKEVEFIAQTMGVTPQEALKQYREDKTLGERIRLYNNELDRLAGDFDFQGLEPDQKAQKVDELRQSYQIPVKPQEQGAPKEITREKAIEYLRKTNGDREKAKKLAAQDGYQF